MTNEMMVNCLKYLEGKDRETTQSKVEIMQYLKNETSEYVDRRQSYAKAHENIVQYLNEKSKFSHVGFTIADLYDFMYKILPARFTKGQFEYGVRVYWSDIFTRIANTKPAQYYINYTKEDE